MAFQGSSKDDLSLVTETASCYSVKEKKNKKKGNKNKQNQGNDHDNSSGKEKAKSDNSQETGDGRHDGESCGADEELRVPKNKKGLYTVCVKYSGSMYEHEVPDTIEEIMELFAEQGDVIETSISKKFSFFRFHNEDEAIAVIKKYNGRLLRSGTVINVLPAKEKSEETPSRGQGGNPKMADRQNNRMGDGQNNNRLQDRTREKDQGGEVILQNGFEKPPMQSKLVDILVSNLDKATTWRELKKHFSMFEPVRADVYHSKAQDGNEW
ncbi:uncharacterized protein [Diadema antillarum]|uniref:uncharacterized protein n=1 Tax=Diadema antillarum TaxID=105358 RepID=UPI003A838ED6